MGSSPLFTTSSTRAFVGAPLLLWLGLLSMGIEYWYGYEALLCGRTGRAGDILPGRGGASGAGVGAPHVYLWPFLAEKRKWHIHLQCHGAARICMLRSA